MNFLKQFVVLTLISFSSAEAFSATGSYDADTLNIRQIDSAIKANRKVQSEKKEDVDDDSWHYYYYDEGKNSFAVEVRSILNKEAANANKIKTTTTYIFINKDLLKVVYRQSNKGDLSTFYFNNGQMLFKNLNPSIHSPSLETLLSNAKTLLEKK